MLDREQSSIISWPRIPLPQDSQDFLPVETAKVTFHFRFFPLLLHERNPETTSQSKNSRAKTIAPQPRPTAVSSHSGFMARARRTTGTRANIPSSLSRSRALARDVSCNAEKSPTEILIRGRVCSTNSLVARNLVFVSLFNCLVSLPNWAEHSFNAS